MLDGFHGHDDSKYFAVLLGGAQADFYSQHYHCYHEDALSTPCKPMVQVHYNNIIIPRSVSMRYTQPWASALDRVTKSLCTEILIRLLARGYDAITRVYNV